MLCKRILEAMAVGLLYGPILDDGKIVVRMYDKSGEKQSSMKAAPAYLQNTY